MPYFFRVSAVNAQGTGESLETTPAYLAPMTATDVSFAYTYTRYCYS